MIPNWRFSLIWYHFFAFSAHSASENAAKTVSFTVSETALGE